MEDEKKILESINEINPLLAELTLVISKITDACNENTDNMPELVTAVVRCCGLFCGCIIEANPDPVRQLDSVKMFRDTFEQYLKVAAFGPKKHLSDEMPPEIKRALAARMAAAQK